MVAGDSIGGFNSASVQSVNTPVGGAAQTVDEMPDGLAYVGSFTVKDNATCAPNNPPLAALTATPGSGTAPLAVNFDASGSRDPDAGDAIASYIFEFGDGSPAVSQSTPSVSHTYATAGDYKASVTATDTHGASSRNAAESVIELQSCFDDADAHIAYDKGWHTVKDADASAGGLHLLQADSGQHGMKFVFDLGSAQGTFDYFFATSQKGGKADLYLDGAFVKTVSYAGNAGSLHQPVSGGRAEFPVAGRGSHTLELRNLSGAAYVDQLCIAGSSSTAQPAAAPGRTTSQSSSLAVGQQVPLSVTVPANATSLAVVAEASGRLPYRLLLLDPSGKVLGAASSSASGVASLDVPVAASGVYAVQLVNLGIGPVQIWSAATPQVRR